MLLQQRRLSSLPGRQSGPQIRTIAGLVRTGAAGDERPAINKALIAIKELGIRRAGGLEQPGHLLINIVQVRKIPTAALLLSQQVLGSILRMGDHAVAADGQHLQLGAEVISQGAEAGLHVFDVRAVGTNEQHQQRPAIELLR